MAQGLSGADLKKRIAEILKDADLETTSAKKVRMQLEEDTKTDLTSRKEEIGKLIQEVIDDMEDEEEEDEEEEEEEDPEKKKSFDDRPVEKLWTKMQINHTLHQYEEETANVNESGRRISRCRIWTIGLILLAQAFAFCFLPLL